LENCTFEQTLLIMLTKKKSTESLDHLPSEFTLDELIDHLLLLDKIDRGDQQSKANKILSEEELDAEIKQ